jgi:hypothetical protein
MEEKDWVKYTIADEAVEAKGSSDAQDPHARNDSGTNDEDDTGHSVVVDENTTCGICGERFEEEFKHDLGTTREDDVVVVVWR